MAENKIKTKVGVLPDATEGSQDELSMESLDALIASKDPEFSESMKKMASDFKNVIVYDDGFGPEYTLEIEKRRWQEPRSWRRLVSFILPFLPWLIFNAKKVHSKTRFFLLNWKRYVKEIKLLLPLVLLWTRDALRKIKTAVGAWLRDFRYSSTKNKLTLLALVSATVATGFLIHRIATKGLLPQEVDIFMGSMSEWAQEKHQYDPKTQLESFYDSTRSSQNIFLLHKVVVNLKPSPESGPNPMGAFEFFVQGAISEVGVEIKDREAEVTDVLQRTIEEMSYDQLSTAEGKKQLCDRLRQQLNKVLSKGMVRRVLIKTALIKP